MANVDEQATVRRVKDFFRDDYKRMKLLANAPVLQGVSYDKTPVTRSKSNYIEDLAIKRVDAQNKLKLVIYAISCLNEFEKIVLEDKLIKNLRNWQIEEKIGYGSTRIYELYHKACINFAATLAMISDIDLIIN